MYEVKIGVSQRWSSAFEEEGARYLPLQGATQHPVSRNEEGEGGIDRRVKGDADLISKRE